MCVFGKERSSAEDEKRHRRLSWCALLGECFILRRARVSTVCFEAFSIVCKLSRPFFVFFRLIFFVRSSLFFFLFFPPFFLGRHTKKKQREREREKREKKRMLREARELCYKHRDAYHEALKKASSSKKELRALEKLFEKHCPRSWVDHFEKIRLDQEKFTKLTSKN